MTTCFCGSQATITKDSGEHVCGACFVGVDSSARTVTWYEQEDPHGSTKMLSLTIAFVAIAGVLLVQVLR